MSRSIQAKVAIALGMPFLLLLLLLARTAQADFSNFCTTLSYQVGQCTDITPRDLIFLLDKSASMNLTYVNYQALDYVEQLYCGFDGTIGSQVGLISFGYDVPVNIPLAPRNSTEWANQVEKIKGTMTITNANTPVAEAMTLALKEFNRAGQPGHARVVIIITG